MPLRSRALWFPRRGVAELRDETLAPSEGPGPGEVWARALASGISRGTEALVLAGRVPASQHPHMRAPHMAGEFTFPVKYGYAWVGQTLEAQPRRVFSLHPHQSHCVLQADGLVELPDAVSDARATLAANMETALNGLWDSALPLGGTKPGEPRRVTIIGAGVVGALVAHACVQLGDYELEVVDIEPRRASFVEQLAAARPSARVRFCNPATASLERHVIFHCSGKAAGMRRALELAAFEARIVELSWYGDTAVELPLGEAFHSRRLRIQASQVGHIAPSHRANTSHLDRLRQAVALLDAPYLDTLLGQSVPFEQLPSRIVDLLERPGAHHVVRYDAPTP